MSKSLVQTLVAVSLLLLGESIVRADFILPEDFVLFAIHPDAQAQATERGGTIRDITAFNGQLYTAYGDWAYDDGPIQIRTLDPVSAAWSSSLLSVGAEAVSHYRVMGNQIFTTGVDPLGVGVQPGGFAVGGPTHQWSQHDVVSAAHVFDINQSSNGDIWLVGSTNVAGMVWRSTDGGNSFSVERQDLPPASAPWWAFSRYTGAALYQDQLYVQRVDLNTVHNPSSLIFDGVAWSVGPDLISQGSGFVSKPQQFGDELVYMDDDLSLGHLYRFDGTTSQYALEGLIHDFQLVDGQIVVLADGGELLYSSDLANWQSAGFAPLDARSLELIGNQFFVGTTGSQILRASKLGGLAGVPEPSSSSVIVLVTIGLMAYRPRRTTLRTLRKPIFR